MQRTRLAAHNAETREFMLYEVIALTFAFLVGIAVGAAGFAIICIVSWGRE